MAGQFFSFQASLGDTSKHNLATLLKAVYTSTTSPPPMNFAQIDIQADTANTGNVLVGDEGLTSSNYGRVLAAKEVWTSYASPLNGVSPLDIFVQASAATQKVNVVLRRI